MTLLISPRRLLAVMVGVIALAGLAPPSQAQNAPMVIAVVDMQVILRDSKGAASATAAIEKQNKAIQAELAKEENALAAEGQQLEQQRVSGKMSAEDFQKKSQQFQEKVAALRQTATSRRQQLQQMQVGAQSQVVAALNATVAEVAKARGISLVLIKGAVLYNLPAFDITPEVLQKLDARLPVVKLSATK